MHDINRMRTGNSAFANQAATAAAKAEQAQKMATLLDNLTNPSIQKNKTIDKLMLANKHPSRRLPTSTRPSHVCALPQPLQLE
jgi:hypothetical protein